MIQVQITRKARLAALSLATALMSGTGAMAQTAAPASTGNPADAAASVPDIVVTATRRETSLQHTAASIAALSGNDLHVQGHDSLQNIAAIVPNVTFNTTSNDSTIYIRGIGNTFINAGGDSGIAFYSENAYVTDDRTISDGLFDIKRIEVLEGPQGALYGRNAVGGAVNVVFNKPTDALEAHADFVAGDHGRAESQGAVSGPLGIAHTNGRISWQIREYGGYTRNLATAAVPDAPNQFDDHHSAAFRAQTETLLDGGGKIDLMYTWYHERENGQALAVEPWQGFVAPAQVLTGEVPSSDPRAVYAPVGYTTARMNDFNANLTQPIGQATLSGTLAYRIGEQRFLNVCDGTTHGGCTYYTGTNTHDVFSDLHLASPAKGLVRWIAGATYSHYLVGQTINVITNSLNGYIGLTPANGGWPFNYFGGGHVGQDSFAVYASTRLEISERFALTGELRHSETIKNLDEFLFFPFFGVAVPSHTVHLHNTFNPYKLGAESQITPDILLYVSYGTANKDGAVNPGAVQAMPVLPETAKTIEAGFKTSFLDRHLKINGALFSTDYTNLQLQQVQVNTDVLANAPRSRIRGVELSVVATPTDRFSFTLNFGALDAKFLEFSNAPTIPGGFGPLQNLAGNRLPYVAPVSVSADAGYRIALPGGYELRPDLAYTYHGRIYFDEFERAANAQGPVGLWDFSASLTPPQSRWRLFGFVHNIGNVTYASGATVYSPLLGSTRAVNYAPPITFGIGASLAFH